MKPTAETSAFKTYNKTYKAIQILDENCKRIQNRASVSEKTREMLNNTHNTFECLTINYIMIHVMHFTKFYDSFTAMLGNVACIGCWLCRNSKPGSEMFKNM